MPVPQRLKPWVDHLNAVRKANPTLSLKQAMIKAKSSYRRGGKKGGIMSLISDPDPLNNKPPKQMSRREWEEWRTRLSA